MATRLNEFKRLLAEFRGLSTWAVGSSVAVPFAAALVDLSPPWPKGIVLVTAIVELLGLVLVFQLLRKAPKRVIDRTLILCVLALLFTTTAYCWQLSLYTYKVPTTEERFVQGDECTPEAKALFSSRCPDLGMDELRTAEYSAERIWTRRSIAAVRMRLVLLWTMSFVLLSGALGSFLVYQLRSRRPAKARPAGPSTRRATKNKAPRTPRGSDTGATLLFALAPLLAAVFPVMLVVACAGEGSTHVQSQNARSPERVTGVIDSTELAALVDPIFAAGMKEERIPGAAFVLVQNGRIVLSRGFGQADVASGRTVRPDQTIFPFASISKVFTATAVMQLAEEGSIDLDADVNQYLKSVRVPPTYPRPVTVAHLLTHTSGLDEVPGRRVRNAAELMPLGRFLADRLIRIHAPGEVTSYSSYGMALAGLLVEDSSGQPFEEYLRRHIWKPLGMTRTFITVPSTLAADLATAYELEGEELVPIPYELYQTPPTSSIVGTAEDMARFMIAHLENGRYGDVRILSEGTATNMHKQHATMHPLVPGWALGFQLDDSNGRRILEHGGDIGGFSELMTLLPDEGVGIFVVHHLESRNLRFDVRRAILDRYFPDQRPLKVPTPQPETAERLTRFAGTYRGNNFCHSCSDGGPNVQDFEVTANEDGTITLWDTRWVEVSPLYFVGLDGRGRIGFAEDKSGRIVAVTSGAWRVLERIDQASAE